MIVTFKARSKKVWKHRQREYQTVNLEGLLIFKTDKVSLVVKLSKTVIRGGDVFESGMWMKPIQE